MTVAADQRYRSQIWVVVEAFTEAFAEVTADIAADIAAEVAAEVVGRTELDLDYGSGDP